jgi:hypothetical protein
VFNNLLLLKLLFYAIGSLRQGLHVVAHACQRAKEIHKLSPQLRTRAIGYTSLLIGHAFLDTLNLRFKALDVPFQGKPIRLALPLHILDRKVNLGVDGLR